MKKAAILLLLTGVVGMLLTGKDFWSREKVKETLYFSKDRFEHIVLEGDMGNVQVLSSEGDEIEVSWKGKHLNTKRDNLVVIEENDTELKINFDGDRFFNVSFFSFGFLNNLDITVHLPEKEYRSLVVKSDVGNVHIKGITANHLTAVTDVANLTVEEVTTQSASLETDVGKMTLNNMAGKLHAESDVGNIVMTSDDITDDLTLLSDVGNIELALTEIPDNVTFNGDSSIGKVKIFGERGSYLSNNADYTVSMKTDVGNITVKARN